MNRAIVGAAGILAMMALCAGCSAEEAQGDRSALDATEGMAMADSVTMASLEKLEPGALATVRAEPVQQRTGPGERPFEVSIRIEDPASRHARRFGTITLLNSLRTRAPNVGQYPCASCHLGRRMVLRDDRITDVHQDIRPTHPAQVGAVCSTCHAADNVELLALRTGDRATLDHAYKLCAQCHFAQAESWAGGAHGKRLDGWQGRRVVMGCADCHDPHAPTLEARVPFRAPQLNRKGNHEP